MFSGWNGPGTNLTKFNLFRAAFQAQLFQHLFTVYSQNHSPRRRSCHTGHQQCIPGAIKLAATIKVRSQEFPVHLAAMGQGDGNKGFLMWIHEV